MPMGMDVPMSALEAANRFNHTGSANPGQSHDGSRSPKTAENKPRPAISDVIKLIRKSITIVRNGLREACDDLAAQPPVLELCGGPAPPHGRDAAF
jgi:hypothetical protein